MILKSDGKTLVLIQNRHKKAKYTICGNVSVFQATRQADVLTICARVNSMNYHTVEDGESLFKTLGESFDRESLLKLLNIRLKEEKEEEQEKKEEKERESWHNGV